MEDVETPVVEEVTGGEEVPTETPPVEEGGEKIEETPTSEEVKDPEKPEKGLSDTAQEKVNKRISAVIKERNQLQARLEAIEKPPLPVSSLPVIPKYEDFETDEEYNQAVGTYTRALVTHEMETRDSAKTLAESQEREIERVSKSTQDFEARSDKYREKQPDFDAVAKSETALFIYGKNSQLALMVQESEVGPELAHYLGSNLDVLSELSTMTTMGAAREIGKLEARIENAGEIKPRAVSKAPDPIIPVGGNQGVVEKELADLEGEDWDKARRAQVAARR